LSVFALSVQVGTLISLTEYEAAELSADDVQRLLELDRKFGREGLTFIRKDNVRSLRAHAKIGGREVAEFMHAGATIAVISFPA